MSSVDWYVVLGVPADASTDEIRAAWKTAVADLDPTAPSFRVFNQAAEVLLDPARRAAYDESRATELAAAEAVEPDAGAEVADQNGAADADDDETGADDDTEATGTPAESGATVRQPDAGSGDDHPARPRPGLVLPVALGCLAVVVLLLGWLVAPQIGDSLAGKDEVLGVSLADDPGLTAVQLDTAQDAARAAVPVALSFDYRHLDEDEDATLPLMTDEFQIDFAPWFAYLKTFALNNKVTVTSTLVATAVSDLGEKKDVPYVDVLVFFNRQETNKSGRVPSVEAAQATLRMVEQDGSWLIDDIKLNQPEPEPTTGGTAEPGPESSPSAKP